MLECIIFLTLFIIYGIIKSASIEKRRVTFILNEDSIDYNLKTMVNIFKIVTIAIILILGIILIKFKPAYSVTLGEQEIGYVESKQEFEKQIDSKIINNKEENVAFVTLDNIKYNFEFVDRNLINEDNVISTLKDNSKNIYFVYEVSSGNDEDAVYVNSLAEAEDLVNTLKQNYSEIEPDLKITTLYLENEVTEESINETKAKIAEDLDAKLEEKKQRDKRTVNGIYLASLPLTGGTISSRYGSVESIRDHVHGGLDLAASYGTPIKAVADGTVKTAGSSGGYGNLVVIDHGNGVQTYYGHCSSIIAKVGSNVKAGDIIAKVGSTGNSTGNHLHFEIRINGVAVNPQKYIY